MNKAVFSWRCQCGMRIKVVGETDPGDPAAKATVKCPGCGDEQTLSASSVFSVAEDIDEIRAKRQ
jgi:hypothetical protein